MSVPPIVVKDLYKSFATRGKVAPILKGVSLEVREGQIVGFLGANGSGKTTTLSIVADLLRPDSGSVTLSGRDPGDPEYHRNAAFIDGGSEYFWLLKVKDILKFYASLCGCTDEFLASQVELCQIGHRYETRWESLSNGERTRVRLCRALLKQPKVLLLDEPTVGLDPDIAEAVREILATLRKQGAAILLTSHYMKDIEELADYIYFLRDGKIVAEGKTGSFTVRHNLVEVTVAAIVESSLRPHWKVTSPHTLELPTDDLPQILAGMTVTSVHSKEDSLEEYFLSVIKG